MRNELHESAPENTNTQGPRNHKKPLTYDPDSEIVRDVHIDRATGLSNTTVWRYRKAGDFPPAIRLGKNSVGWLRADIRAWLRSRTERRGA